MLNDGSYVFFVFFSSHFQTCVDAGSTDLNGNSCDACCLCIGVVNSLPNLRVCSAYLKIQQTSFGRDVIAGVLGIAVYGSFVIHNISLRLETIFFY